MGFRSISDKVKNATISYHLLRWAVNYLHTPVTPIPLSWVWTQTTNVLTSITSISVKETIALTNTNIIRAMDGLNWFECEIHSMHSRMIHHRRGERWLRIRRLISGSVWSWWFWRIVFRLNIVYLIIKYLHFPVYLPCDNTTYRFCNL